MRRRAWCGAAVALAGVLTAGCGGNDGTSAKAAPAVTGGGFPVTVTDCAGARTTFQSAPRKIVTSNASSLELLLRLGAGSRVIGTGFPPGKGTLPAPLDAEAAKVPVLGTAVIPKEKLLGSGADLYIDTFASMDGMAAASDFPTEAEFKAAGIRHVFLKSTACAAQRKGPLTDLTTVEDDITTLGAITGTSPKAQQLVAGMRQKIAGVQRVVAGIPQDKRPTYFFFDYDAGTKQPSVVCNRQIANAVITLAGARNAFADCDADFRQVGWEDVISRDPDWIQLAVRNRGSQAAQTAAFDAAEHWLRSNPATRGMKAVREGHFLRIGSEQTTIAGVTDADTVREIARTLYPGKVA